MKQRDKDSDEDVELSFSDDMSVFVQSPRKVQLITEFFHSLP